MVAMDRGKFYVSGKLTGLNRPERDFFCKTPAETREDLPKGVDVVAFQCRNPIHRAHYEVRRLCGVVLSSIPLPFRYRLAVAFFLSVPLSRLFAASADSASVTLMFDFVLFRSNAIDSFYF